MGNKIEKGDIFIIDWEKIRKLSPKLFICIEPDKEFVTDDVNITLGIISYKNKISKGCICNNCSYGGIESTISIEVIKVIRKRLQMDRNDKFKSLGI